MLSVTARPLRVHLANPEGDASLPNPNPQVGGEGSGSDDGVALAAGRPELSKSLTRRRAASHCAEIGLKSIKALWNK